MMTKPPHVERMEAERAELNDRIEKLDAFVGAAPAFQQLHEIDKALLKDQSRAMKSYRSILDTRLERATR